MENQMTVLREYASRNELNIVETYQEEESAWRGGRQHELARLMRDAQRGRFTVVLIWALDRLSREGPLAILTRIHTLGFHGVDLISMQEPWTEARLLEDTQRWADHAGPFPDTVTLEDVQEAVASMRENQERQEKFW